MRKLTSVCLLSVACTSLFMGCQKDDSMPIEPSITPSRLYRDISSVSRQVLELKSQKSDFQHITAQYSQEVAQPTTTPNNSTARFTLTYFSFFGGEKDTIFNETQLLTTLIKAGLSDKEARLRTDCLFKTNQCSPLFLTETARLIAPVLPSHTEGSFICELFKPYDAGQLETFQEKTLHNAPIVYQKRSIHEPIKAVNKLIGVSGSIAAFGNTHIELYLNNNEANTHFVQRFDAQEVRRILQKTRGYTEGEAVYLELILGTLSEQTVWFLFENDIVPEWKKTSNTHFDTRLARLSFRYNYVEIIGNIGRLGFTIYDLDGFVD